jgi:murein DD-endopeptidase MepM/ murein hydrolase activator NlpD
VVFTLLDNEPVKINVNRYRRLTRGRLLVISLAFFATMQLSSIELIGASQAQTNKEAIKKAPQVRQKSSIPNTKSVGFKDMAAGKSSKSNSLNPELFRKKDANEFIGDTIGNLDYRVQRGCYRRSFSESNLPANLGIDNPQLSEFFKNQTKGFFDRMRGNCMPYAVALGSRNRFDSLSIMNGPIQDSKTEILTVTPAAAGGFLVQQDYLRDESSRYTEIELPLRDVLYDPRKVSDKLPVELVWELNSLIKQIYPEESNSLENTDSVVRLLVDFGDRDHWAQIWATEILDPSNKEVFASAFWLERDDIPGGFFTGSGEAIERAFWTNPLSYRRISRGVGNVPVSRKKPTKIAANTNATAPVAVPQQRYRAHMGIDYAAPIGTPIFSVANGKVVHLGYNGAFGNLIILEHDGGYRTYYAHLSNYNVELALGNEVRRGLEIGYVGSTGRSTGPHLHFELRKDGVYIDPYSPRMQLDLWSMRDNESGQLTREILLLGSPPKL